MKASTDRTRTPGEGITEPWRESGHNRHRELLRAALLPTLFVLTHASLLLLLPFRLSRFALCAALYGAGTILMLYLLFHPRSQLLVRNRSRVVHPCRPGFGRQGGAARQCVALTFDDGPGVYTSRLLDILRQAQIQATFFVIGRHAEQYPDLVRRATAEGHLVANHTYSHPPLFCFLSPRRLRAEIELGQQAVYATGGYRPRYFRSPVGLRHPLLTLYLRAARLEYISWAIRAFDTVSSDADAVLRRILRRVTPGDIILLHDKSNSAVMLDLLPCLIDALKQRGFEFVLVDAGPPVAYSNDEHLCADSRV